MSEGQAPLQLPRQTDTEAASSATPDTERMPRWDDEGWNDYLYAVDRWYRFDWDVTHGMSPEEASENWESGDDD